ncbi:DUF6572 domain-containing protein [Mesobacillus subterraneus]|uniref:Branched-chain amino acid ABC transporter substrate-binding protein n=1 Tax=Mesobacillus subterraneus TaxID=285983 RepID=A0A3R9EDC8_9BACI|nr:DUF6572 domain-containing protein [Mesobacillus subterraneus]RSD27812.1 hypothetical protein EJA10_08545 [Mesobacillus subterraneus]
MGLEDSNSIDAIGVHREQNCVTLALIDSEGWENEKQHLIMLQEKLNSYLNFILSGEIYSSYPDAKGKNVEINIYFKYDFPEKCKIFLGNVEELMTTEGITLSHRVG